MARLFTWRGLMPVKAKNRSKSKRSADRKRKPAIVEIHPEFPQEAGGTVDFDSVRQEMTKRIISRALELVDDMMQHIKDGNFQAMKYLFEAVGLLPIKVEDAQSARNELGKKLSSFFEESGRPEHENLAPEAGVSSLAVK